jgi:hypothetical protein
MLAAIRASFSFPLGDTLPASCDVFLNFVFILPWKGNGDSAAIREDGSKCGKRRRGHFVDDEECKCFGSGACFGARIRVAVENGGIQTLHKQLPVVCRLVALDTHSGTDVEHLGEGFFTPHAFEIVKIQSAEKFEHAESAVEGLLPPRDRGEESWRQRDGGSRHRGSIERRKRRIFLQATTVLLYHLPPHLSQQEHTTWYARREPHFEAESDMWPPPRDMRHTH